MADSTLVRDGDDLLITLTSDEKAYVNILFTGDLVKRVVCTDNGNDGTDVKSTWLSCDIPAGINQALRFGPSNRDDRTIRIAPRYQKKNCPMTEEPGPVPIAATDEIARFATRRLGVFTGVFGYQMSHWVLTIDAANKIYITVVMQDNGFGG